MGYGLNHLYVSIGIRAWLATRNGIYKLAAHFRPDLRVRVCTDDVEQGVFLIRRQICGISADGCELVQYVQERNDEPLAESEEGLVPEDRQLLCITGRLGLVGVGKADEVKDESINHFEGECMLLIDEHPNEEGIGAWIDE